MSILAYTIWNILNFIFLILLLQYRVVLNGLGYILFGIPEKDLENIWNAYNMITTVSGETPLLNDRDINTIEVYTYIRDHII